MRLLADRIRTRLVPGILTALGVTFLAAGLLSYTQPATAEPGATPTPAVTGQADVVATPSPLITLPPLDPGPSSSLSPSSSPSPRITPLPIASAPSTPGPVPKGRKVTRVRVPALDIDLPVIISTVVPCNVALDFVDPHFGVPGQHRATYLYAHAQAGMFLPLLTQSQISNGSKMKGMIVEVFTNDDQRFLYVISKVIRHVPATTAFVAPFNVKTDQVWLQTSEGKGSQPKLQVVADLLSQDATDHATANPTPHPRSPTIINGREVC